MVEYSDPRIFGFDPKTVMTALMPYERFSSKTRRLILGIDMGIASVGVCLIDIRNHEIVLMAEPHLQGACRGQAEGYFCSPERREHTTWLSLGSPHDQAPEKPKEDCPRY